MKSALLVVDVQQSFRQRPYWQDTDVPAFIGRLQGLIDLCDSASVPVLQVFHADGDGAFSLASGHVRPFPELRIRPTEVFHKRVHSAMFGTNEQQQTLDAWLRAHDIDHLIVTGIRTEQCCETTTRHASDLGYRVTYAIDATLTFPMVAADGREYSTREIAERTALVLDGRFAKVAKAAEIRL